MTGLVTHFTSFAVILGKVDVSLRRRLWRGTRWHLALHRRLHQANGSRGDCLPGTTRQVLADSKASASVGR